MLYSSTKIQLVNQPFRYSIHSPKVDSTHSDAIIEL